MTELAVSAFFAVMVIIGIEALSVHHRSTKTKQK